ncbi:MAG: phage tail sheath family protein, partial [Caldilineaceae bacterium]|nr:phage tail sheath family protein [Caldilineaceae bacterium]
AGAESPGETLDADTMVRILTVDLLIQRPIIRPQRPNDRFGESEFFEGFALHPQHRLGLVAYFTERPDSRLLHLTVPLQIDPDSSLTTGSALAFALLGEEVLTAAYTGDLEEAQRVYQLTNGSDGAIPTLEAYAGEDAQQAKSGLASLEDLEDISILAAPGYSHDYATNGTLIRGIQNALISHSERMRYRIAVLDAPNNQVVSEIRNYRGMIDSTRAALYYPWIKILDPISSQELLIPPSGSVAGIFARNDVDHGVHKTPANEVVRQAIGFEFLLNKAQQDVLNPEGINCFRFFEGRGYRLWGGRTASSDPEWKYVNVRRYFLFLERSIELGTQWVVFENNGPALWANVRRTVEDFLFNEWKSGHLLGEKPELAYFVRCDRSTMTQNDLDNGRLICLIGVAPLRPAEFVIFRIGQFTADRPN